MFNFTFGTKLAIQQDQYIKMFKNDEIITKSQIQNLKDNLWVKIASKLAPNNLVIRQLCLIDIFTNAPKNTNKIFNLINILSYKKDGDYRIFAEGYSYFNYTMNILDIWITKFENDIDITKIMYLIDLIKQGFIATSYVRNDLLYPAPFGDLRDIPLNSDLQIKHIHQNIRLSTVLVDYTSDSVNYKIEAKPIGFNTHIPKDDMIVTITNGCPESFKFYEGYDKKYKNCLEELIDTFHVKRLTSLIKMLLLW